ncbi:hypothetical protein Hypma_004484 [Hypsizygus marmoreus]|uniref:Uncharacterized protein n=1 Tax=Hypsizygus marmoreus TaxID=39966 RepID=A0A369JYE9_HYPMA|nr:hypothetical protein Hypma_004484 [Hypsizygus marmoreus]
MTPTTTTARHTYGYEIHESSGKEGVTGISPSERRNINERMWSACNLKGSEMSETARGGTNYVERSPDVLDACDVNMQRR